ncbi:MAG: biotin/lipoyl-containing protein, partial [Pseudomonadales bacterium]
EGALRGVDSRILVAQVPGGMLTNMENQLREQQAGDKLDAVLAEIPRVRKELGYIPLVTPTSQIVGTQAVLNILTGERYKSISKETTGVLKGEYGATPAPVDAELQARVLEGGEPILCRPADLLAPEMDTLQNELGQLAQSKQIKLADNKIDDVLTYALFQQIGLKFLENRGDPTAFEAPPQVQQKPVATDESAKSAAAGGAAIYSVTVAGEKFVVQVEEGGDVSAVQPAAAPTSATPATQGGEPLVSPLAGNIFKINVKPGQAVHAGDVVIILEAMKMETAVSAPQDGTVSNISVREGDAVSVGDVLLSFA